MKTMASIRKSSTSRETTGRNDQRGDTRSNRKCRDRRYGRRRIPYEGKTFAEGTRQDEYIIATVLSVNRISRPTTEECWKIRRARKRYESSTFTVSECKGYFAVEDNKKDCAEKIWAAIADEPRMDVKLLMTKYPQGAERQLIYAVTRRAINSSMLPADAGCIVDNVEDFDRHTYRGSRRKTADGEGCHRKRRRNPRPPVISRYFLVQIIRS